MSEITRETVDELRLSERLRAAACGIAEGNVADPHGHRVGLLRQAADALAAAEAERDRLRAAARVMLDATFEDGHSGHTPTDECPICRAHFELSDALGDAP